ncbi:MAG: thiamine-phosphate kinase [Verrucomicrobiota bacterium]
MGEESRELQLSEIGEEALVSRLTALIPSSPEVIVGPGDDCAVIEREEGDWQLLKTDCLVEGVHFDPKSDPVQVGRKAIHRTISDIAAMGGIPQHALVTLICDSNRSLEEVEGWHRGIVEAANLHRCAVVGGETSRLPSHGAVISIAMSGTVERNHLVTRSGAVIGDAILVTGKLGGAYASGRHLTFSPRLEPAHWLVEHAGPSAMMDLSDGLGSDLPRLADASGVGYEIQTGTLPCHDGCGPEEAIEDGEDYELLLTMPTDRWEHCHTHWGEKFPELPITRIGTIVEETRTPLSRGWEHHRDNA